MSRIRRSVVLSFVAAGLGFAVTNAVKAETLHCELAIAGTMYNLYNENGQWVGYQCYGNPNNCCRF